MMMLDKGSVTTSSDKEWCDVTTSSHRNVWLNDMRYDMQVNEMAKGENGEGWV